MAGGNQSPVRQGGEGGTAKARSTSNRPSDTSRDGSGGKKDHDGHHNGGRNPPNGP